VGTDRDQEVSPVMKTAIQLVLAAMIVPGSSDAGVNAYVAKGAVHVEPHMARTCADGLPAIASCEDIVTTEPGADVDVFPVFYDLVEYQGFDYALDWPGTGSCAFTSCSDLTIADIVHPGDGIAHAWYTCQPGPVAVPGWGWIQDYGTVCLIDHPTAGGINVGDCQGVIDIVAVVCSTGIGGSLGGDPCRELPGFGPYIVNVEATGTGEIAPDALVCLAGDLDAITVTLTVLDSLGVPVPGIEVEIIPTPDADPLEFCPGEGGGEHNDTTDASGVISVTFRKVGGCGHAGWSARSGHEILGSSEPIYVLSPDCAVSDLKTDLSDFIMFCGAYLSSDPCCDYVRDGYVDLADFMFFAEHYRHACQ
jgi:hypothetical protein